MLFRYCEACGFQPSQDALRKLCDLKYHQKKYEDLIQILQSFKVEESYDSLEIVKEL